MTESEQLIRPMRLGPLALANNLSLAPMHKRTHLGFRLLARRQGAALTHTEMATPEDLLGECGPRKGLNILATTPEDRPLGIQIAPRDVGPLVEAVKRVAEQQAADVFDLNFACPSTRVSGGGRGAAFLRDPEAGARLVEAAVRASAVPVKVKLRYGYTDLPKDREWAMDLARWAVDAGAVAVTLHARSAEQQYHGRADWDEIARWTDLLPVPVIGSGDLRSPEAVLEMLRHTRCAGASIARGAVGAPWIFRQVLELAATGTYLPVTMDERRGSILQHYEGLITQYGPEIGLRMITQTGLMYTRNIAGAAEARLALQASRTDEEFRGVVDRYFREA
jgi:tRNA-dihydrouridine synthase B